MPWHGVDQQPPSSADATEKVQIYLYSLHGLFCGEPFLHLTLLAYTRLFRKTTLAFNTGAEFSCNLF